jgi:hypothetical protein
LGHQVGGAIRQRVNRTSRLLPSRSDKAAAIHDKKVLHVVDTVVTIDDGFLWVAAHAAGTHQMTCDCEILHRVRPDFLRTRCFQNFTALLEKRGTFKSG